MRFLGKAFLGLFLAALTVALIATAANMVRVAVQDRLNSEPRPRMQREQSFAVNVVTVVPQAISPTISTFGTIRNRRTLELRVRRGGPITEIAEEFTEGGEVSAGQLLIATDDTDEKAAVARTNTELAAAEAAVEDAQISLDFAERDVAFGQEQLALQEQSFERQQALVSRGVGTEMSIETAELAVAAARQALLNKERAVAQADAEFSRAENQRELAALALEEAQRQLIDTRIFAEFDGILSGVTAVRGRLVNDNEQIGQLIDPAELEAEFRVSNAEYTRLVGDDGRLSQAAVEITMELQGFRVEAGGTILRESAVVEAGQTGRQLFARLDPENARQFRPGDFVTVAIQEPEIRGVAILPASAADTQSKVLVLDDQNRLEEHEVAIVRRQGDMILVRAFDLVGRDVVAVRTPLLGAGILVKPTRPGGVPSEATEPEEIELSDERRAKLIEAIEANSRMPADVKARILETLNQPKVPAEMVERLESRMGG